MDLKRVLSDLPAGSVVFDADLLARYGSDLTGRFHVPPIAVLRPRSVEEVAAALRLCDQNRIAVVPQGGNTGLVGGAIPRKDEVILSLERLKGVGEVAPGSDTLVAEGGASLANVEHAARAHGLTFPIDFAARSTATIGGMVATNAGGALVMRYGTMRDRVAGLQVVLADGTIVDHLDRPDKDSSGYDVTRLFPGSEGVLGVVTAARLKLLTRAAHRAVVIVALPGVDEASRAVATIRQSLVSLEAADFFLRTGLDLVREHFELPALFTKPHEAFLILSCAGETDPTEAMASAIEELDDVEDVAVAQSPEQRTALWRYRELHNEAINVSGVPHKLDVAVKPLKVAELITKVDAWLSSERPGCTGIYYGHLADGNVHVNVIGADRHDDTIDETILTVVAATGGSISAEHGIGQAKNRWLHLSKSPEEIGKMRAIKKALDPNGILNPGKLLPLEEVDQGRTSSV